MPSAVIVRATLPAGLERLRRASVDDAADGVPAHLTLLYPFVEPDHLGPALRARLSRVAARHAPIEYRLTSMALWPDTVYVAVEPEAPFVALQRDLQAAFPDYPIYGQASELEFVPHVTIAEGAAVDDPAVRSHLAWRTRPQPARAERLEVIATDGRPPWRTVWRIALGR